MKNDRIKNDRIKSDRIKSGRIKSDRIKTDRIKRITDPSEYTLDCETCAVVIIIGYNTSSAHTVSHFPVNLIFSQLHHFPISRRAVSFEVVLSRS
jgi:hypothetical protein